MLESWWLDVAQGAGPEGKVPQEFRLRPANFSEICLLRYVKGVNCAKAVVIVAFSWSTAFEGRRLIGLLQDGSRGSGGASFTPDHCLKVADDSEAFAQVEAPLDRESGLHAGCCVTVT